MRKTVSLPVTSYRQLDQSYCGQQTAIQVLDLQVMSRLGERFKSTMPRSSSHSNSGTLHIITRACTHNNSAFSRLMFIERLETRTVL